MKLSYDESDVIDFGRKTVERFADKLLERATAGLPPDAVLSCRAIRRIIEEERAKWLNGPIKSVSSLAAITHENL